MVMTMHRRRTFIYFVTSRISLTLLGRKVMKMKFEFVFVITNEHKIDSSVLKQNM